MLINNSCKLFTAAYIVVVDGGNLKRKELLCNRLRQLLT